MTKLQRSGSGAFAPFTEPLPSCDQDSRIECPCPQTDTNDRGLISPAWFDQCFETSLSLDVDWQLESLLSPERIPSEEMKLEQLMETKTQVATTTNPLQISAPASPESSDSSYHHQTNAIPRHKRPSHKRAELKRRDKIKTRLDEIKAQVPTMTNKGKMSETAVLSTAAEYTKHLFGDCERFSTEAGNLRREIESLRNDIHSLQKQLPAAGLEQETVEKSQRSMDRLYRSYQKTSIKDNWKFYLFGFMMKPLFETYKEEVSTDNIKSFKASVEEWTKNRLGLSNLRHQTLENMRDITRQTDIMSNPAALPKQALASIGHLSDSPSTASLSSSSHLSSPMTSAPSASVNHLPTPVDSAPSSELRHLLAPVTLVSSSANIPQLSALITSSSPSTNLIHQSASKPSLPAFTSSHPFSSLPTQSLSLTSSSFIVPRTTVPQNLAPQFSSPACKPSACTSDKAYIQNHHRLSKPSSAAKASASRKRTSGLNSSGTVSGRETDESLPVARKREFLDRSTAQLPFGPLSVFTPARHVSAEQQPVQALQIDMNDINQLAVSVKETSLHMNPPVAVVTPTPALSSPITVVIPSMSLQQSQFPTATNVVHLITDSQCHEYDFDLTDIPLPDL